MGGGDGLFLFFYLFYFFLTSLRSLCSRAKTFIERFHCFYLGGGLEN